VVRTAAAHQGPSAGLLPGIVFPFTSFQGTGNAVVGAFVVLHRLLGSSLEGGSGGRACRNESTIDAEDDAEEDFLSERVADRERPRHGPARSFSCAAYQQGQDEDGRLCGSRF
jgi:hypothetical protein